MGHNVDPNQNIRIITIHVAVSADANEAIVSDLISSLLSEQGVEAENPIILDWQYGLNGEFFAIASSDPEEGEIFHLPWRTAAPMMRRG